MDNEHQEQPKPAEDISESINAIAQGFDVDPTPTEPTEKEGEEKEGNELRDGLDVALFKAGEALKTKWERREEERQRHIEEHGTPCKVVQTVSPSHTLQVARFPQVIVRRATDITSNPHPQVANWASRYDGSGTPWVWIQTNTGDIGGLEALASIAIEATRIAGPERMRATSVAYVTAYDLCGMVDSANQYGPNNKWSTLQEYKDCGLLLLGGVGGERADRHTLEIMLQLLGARWQNMLPTALESAIGLSQWRGKYQRVNENNAQTLAQYVMQGLKGWSPNGDWRDSFIDLREWQREETMDVTYQLTDSKGNRLEVSRQENRKR